MEADVKDEKDELHSADKRVEEDEDGPGKSCESSSSEKFRALQCPQNSVICDKVRMEICESNVGVI